MRRRLPIVGKAHRGKTAAADRDLAVLLVDEYLLSLGGEELGWEWGREEARLAKAIAALLGRVRGR